MAETKDTNGGDATGGDATGGDATLDGEVRSFEETLARSLHLSGLGLRESLDAIVKGALETVEAADYAGLILVERAKLVPLVTMGEPPFVLDALQQQLGTGPCFDAASQQLVIGIDDTRLDQRWAEFATRAAALGVLSMLCVPLWVGQEVLGTLSLYSGRPFAFSEQNAEVLTLFATHAAVALAHSRNTAHLRTALVNRDIIGQAKGVLMERHRITPDAAFEVLSKASQAQNRKLIEVAQHLTETGQLEA